MTGVIFTQSHIDHFGGAKEVADPKKLAGRDVPVIVPEGFFIESVNENLMAGNHMSRRAMYMYGNLLPKSPVGTCFLVAIGWRRESVNRQRGTQQPV